MARTERYAIARPGGFTAGLYVGACPAAAGLLERQYAWAVSEADSSSAGAPPGEEVSFDLLAGSLRASSGDLDTFVEVLGAKLERALPGRAKVERRSVRRWSKERRVKRIELELGAARYLLAAEGGAVETRRASTVRGIVLKSETLSLAEWIDALARDLAAEAETSEQARLTLEQLLGA
jgi:hypothetical protein